MIERIKKACRLYSNTTIKDDVYGAMYTLEEIEENIGFKLVEGWTQIDEDNYLLVEFEERKNSTWICMELDDKEDYDYIVSGAWNEPLEDDEEFEDDEE